MKNKTNSVTKINDVVLLTVENNGEKYVPIKPICEILGVSYQSQFERLKKDKILGSTIMPSMTVGADGKTREMSCLPYKYIFGWLFKINSDKVKPEAQENLIKYQKICYDILFDAFSDAQVFLEEKFRYISEIEEEEAKIKADFSQAKSKLKEIQDKLSGVKNITLEEWKMNNRQLSIWNEIEE